MTLALLVANCRRLVATESFNQVSSNATMPVRIRLVLYGGCSATCTYGPFCGDGTVNGSDENL